MGRLYEAIVSWSFTAWYGRLMRRIDESGLRETRRELLREARGRVLDLGSGTGANLPLFPAAVEELVLAEPSAHMLRVLRHKVGESGGGAVELVQAPAESRPGSTRWPASSSREGNCSSPRARTLGGSRLRADPGPSRTAWRFIADGCHCNRDSLAIIEASPLEVERFERGHMPIAPLFMKPLIVTANRSILLGRGLPGRSLYTVPASAAPSLQGHRPIRDCRLLPLHALSAP